MLDAVPAADGAEVALYWRLYVIVAGSTTFAFVIPNDLLRVSLPFPKTSSCQLALLRLVPPTIPTAVPEVVT